MASTSYAPEDHPLNRTAAELLNTFDLLASVQRRLAPGFPEPHLADLEIIARGHDGFFDDYHNGSSRQNRYFRTMRLMRPGETIFGKPFWAVIFKYIAVSWAETHWDIEANFTYEDRDGNVTLDSRQAKYRLSEIILSEDESYDGSLENDFLNVENKLRQLDAVLGSLAAWTASGYSMQVRCRKWSCQSATRAARVFTTAQIARFAEDHLSPETLRARLRCSQCGEKTADILLHGMSE